jgi:hypothetical protein
MYVTHSRFYRIVSGHVLQRERVGVLTGLSQKRVPQSMQASIRVRVDLPAQASHLILEHPATEGLRGVTRVGENILALGLREQALQNLFNLAIDEQFASARPPLSISISLRHSPECRARIEADRSGSRVRNPVRILGCAADRTLYP